MQPYSLNHITQDHCARPPYTTVEMEAQNMLSLVHFPQGNNLILKQPKLAVSPMNISEQRCEDQQQMTESNLCYRCLQQTPPLLV